MKSRILSVLFSTVLLATGCGKKAGFQAMEVPKEQAQLQDLKDSIDGEETESFDDSDLSDVEAPSTLSWKHLGEMAKWVVQNEAKRIGAACNFFIQRVLFLMGFGRGSWMANDFDDYVKSQFSSYKEKSFQYDRDGESQNELKSYIWSFPERTGLILQWKRAVGHGHIAVVQRIGNDLVIYHASLNTFRPKSQTIRPEVLLYKTNDSESYTLNVFSDFKKTE